MKNAIIDTITAASGGSAPASLPTLREASQEFESIFVAQMMKTMRSTVPKSDLMGADDSQDIYRDMLDQELSRRIAFAGGFGIGEMLYQQLKGKQVIGSQQK